MRAYWSQTRADGRPLQDGTFCRVTDLEDGTNPIYTYGNSMEEVFSKIERTMGTAQIALTKRPSPQPQPAAPGNGGGSPAASTGNGPRRLSADEVVQRTSELSIAGKSGAAAATLIEDATGLNFREMVKQQYAATMAAWERDHPEFYAHAGNRTLLTNEMFTRTGGKLAAVTPQMLTDGYHKLLGEGLLFEEPASSQEPPPTPSRTFPGGSQVQQTERPIEKPFATGMRSTRFSAPQSAPTRTLKYTEDQLRKLPDATVRELIERQDKAYLEACEYYWPSRATA